MGLRRYNSISDYYKRTFQRYVQKISIDAGFTCPNRDGTKGVGGCTYCNNEAFTPAYCSPKKSITEQINAGIEFFSRKYKDADFLAYFQAYSNTYAPLSVLKDRYQEALKHDRVIGLIISTRPDCVDEKILDYLYELSKKYYIVIEYGIESTKNETLALINRGHTYEESVKSILMTAERGLKIGVHLILGLPGEDRATFIEHAKKISQLPINFIKLHQLQIIANTLMAKDYALDRDKYFLFEDADSYLDVVVDFLEYLSPKIIVERIASESPQNLLIAPHWGQLKNYQLIHMLEKKLQDRNTWQGKMIQK